MNSYLLKTAYHEECQLRAHKRTTIPTHPSKLPLAYEADSSSSLDAALADSSSSEPPSSGITTELRYVIWNGITSIS